MDDYRNEGVANLSQDDLFPFSFSDGYGDMCAPSGFDQASTSFGDSTGIWPYFGGSHTQPEGCGFQSGNGWHVYSQGKRLFQKSGPGFDYSLSDFVNVESSRRNDSNDGGSGSSASGNLLNERLLTIPKSLDVSLSLADKMLKALFISKDSFGSGFLAQFWIPVRCGDDVMLSTYDQPYLLDHMLFGYREISRSYTFAARKAPDASPGLPGRVFISRRPEWTSNVLYYNNKEYLRVNHAAKHCVYGSIAVPVFDASDQSCSAVFELITNKEKSNFYSELETVCRALQDVNLRTSVGQTKNQNLTTNQRDAYAEILDVLTAVCHEHRLPLALTWVPCFCDGAKGKCQEKNVERDSIASNMPVLQILESACYIGQPCMRGFLRTCAEHQLTEGQGNAGKALQSNHPFFCPDVKAYDIDEYPLVHHARKFGLTAAVATRLRSIHTGDDDYVVEFFLPADCKECVEQELLLNNLSITMQRLCKSLRTVSNTAGRDNVKEVCDLTGFPSPYISRKCLAIPDDLDSSKDLLLQTQHLEINDLDSKQFGQAFVKRKHLDKKRSTVEKNISLSVLQQYFSGSLKDAAKSIGVCPTTLKRICRQHGIPRWPSRKIHKVNRSLQKIQTVIDSVQGVKGRLRYDPLSGSLVAAVDTSGKFVSGDSDTLPRDAIQPSSFIEGLQSYGKSKPDEEMAKKHEIKEPEEFIRSAAIMDEKENSCGPPIKHNHSSNLTYLNDIQGMIGGKDASVGSYLATDGSHQLCFGRGIPTSRTSNLMTPANGTWSGTEIVEHNHPNSSNTTDSLDSETSTPLSRKCSEEKEHSENKGCTITVKATYKEDKIRFRLLPSWGFIYMLEEIGRRFKLEIGTFQLKYMDDESEWVMLASDADLQECIEILDLVGSSSVKLLVRDVPFSVESSGSNNCLLNYD